MTDRPVWGTQELRFTLGYPQGKVRAGRVLKSLLAGQTSCCVRELSQSSAIAKLPFAEAKRGSAIIHCSEKPSKWSPEIRDWDGVGVTLLKITGQQKSGCDLHACLQTVVRAERHSSIAFKSGLNPKASHIPTSPLL